MKIVTYKPKGEEFAGEVEINLPSVRQRLKYFRDCNFTEDESGAVSGLKNIEALCKMYDVAENHIGKITLKRGSVKYKDFSQMADDSSCDDICGDIVKIILEGSLGESSK